MYGNKRSLFGAIALAAVAAGLGGCAEEYFRRADPISTFAGDAVRRNIAIHTINPRPNYAYDNHIHHSGQRMEGAMARYNAGGTDSASSDASEEAVELDGPQAPGDPQ